MWKWLCTKSDTGKCVIVALAVVSVEITATLGGEVEFLYISTSTSSLCWIRTNPAELTFWTFTSLLFRMALLHSVLCQVFSWAGLCLVLRGVGTGLVVAAAAWTARLLLRHTWYTHRLSCFNKPPTRSWLLGHLGQVLLGAQWYTATQMPAAWDTNKPVLPTDAEHRGGSPAGGRLGADLQTLLLLVPGSFLSPGQTLPSWLCQTSPDGIW